MVELIIKNWDKITTWIFWITSALFAGLSWWYSKLAYERDNSKIRFFAKKMSTFQQWSKEVIWLALTNIWRRPVSFKNQLWLSHSEKDKHALLPYWMDIFMNNSGNLPEVLNEWQEHQIVLYYEWFKEQLKKDEFVKSFTIYDTSGKAHIAMVHSSDFPDITKPNLITKIKIYFNKFKTKKSI